MSTPLTDFLIELSENPAKLREFRRAPDRLARNAGLNPAEHLAVVRRDARAIRRLLGSSLDPVQPPIFVQSTVVDFAAPA